MRPEITVDENNVISVDMKDLEYVRAYTFYAESYAGIDTYNWSPVNRLAKAVTGSPFGAKQEFKTHHEYENLEGFVLPEAEGDYVVFLTYVDAHGVEQQMSVNLSEMMK